MATFTNFLKLYKPITNEVGWDDNANSNYDIIDGFVAQFMNIPNFVGVWLNAHAYAVSQIAMDPQTGAFYSCLIANTSAATGTFAQDRTAHSTFWALNTNPVTDAAAQAAASAAAAAASAAGALNSLTTFQNTYYGAFATDPLNDPHGGARTSGDIYFNTTTHRLRVWDGVSWAEITTTFADAPTTPTTSVYLRGADHTWVAGVPQTGGTFSGNVNVANLGVAEAIPTQAATGVAVAGHFVSPVGLGINLYNSTTSTTGWRYFQTGSTGVGGALLSTSGSPSKDFRIFMTVNAEAITGNNPATLTLPFTLNTSGNMTITGTASKPGGGTFAASSDVRIKDIVGPYPHGLEELLEMLPQMFTYKGNDNFIADDGSIGQPIHPDTTTQYIGLIAQECEPYMPELVTQTSAYIDGVLQTDVRELDATGVIYALVNAVAELNTKIVAVDTSGYLPLTGGILTGQLWLAVDPTDPTEAVTKNYADTSITAAITQAETDISALYLSLSTGGTVAGYTTFSAPGNALTVTNTIAVGALTQTTIGSTLAISTPVAAGGATAGNITLTAGGTGTGTGGGIQLSTGTGLFTGNITLQTAATTAAGFAASGAVNVTTGNSNGTTGSGGIILTTGNATAASTAAGGIFLTTGNATSGAGGDMALTFGSGTTRGGRLQIAGTGSTNNLTIAPGAAAATAIALTQSGTGGISITPALTLAAGGSFTGTFSGTHTYSGATTFSGIATFSNAGAASSIQISGGGLTLSNAASTFVMNGATSTFGPTAGNKLQIAGGAATTNPIVLSQNGTGGIQFNTTVGFNSVAPVARPSITGSRAGNAALASLLTALAATGLITDTTTA